MVKYMLNAVVLFCLMGYLSAGEIPQEFKEVAGDIPKSCIAETGVTVDLIERARTGDLAEDGNLKCYLKCIMVNLGMISEKGLNFEKMIEMVQADMKDLAKQLSTTCKDIKPNAEGDQCQLAFDFMKCFYKGFPNDFFVL
ncbi:general odorant-binding protein 83a [Diachasma alloeum]|uniref:Odorant binding protein 14 n=1 Tax=Diachasma alloeum TaxID=454923 RepID=A0A4E0RLW9_9HYME|nr:general odorant-binding protein 83a [Diachasma alloeum]THK33119.1 odorant binding protein 14 [Diachasma alloeum]